MKTLNLQQGTPEWHAHRSQHFNASDAPAMLGCCPYRTRNQLIRELATGIAPEIDEETAQRMAEGHRAEGLARPLAEQIIGEELFPCVGSEGFYSASFDGLTMLEDQAFEHKSMNATLRAALVEDATGADLPKNYRVQMEQQCMVSGVDRVLFMASKWNRDGGLIEERNCWYEPDPALRAEIIAGWKQLEADVAAYEPEAAAAPVATGRAPEQLPALRVEVTGMVTASNLAEFKASAIAVLEGINRDLQTDEDFANAEQTVKWCKGVEDRLQATKDAVLAQTADIEAVFRTMDEVTAETRRIRLDLDKLVKAEKENRKGEIVQAGARAVREHYDSINATLGEHRIIPPQSLSLDLGMAIKGKKSISSMRDAVDGAVAQAKIDASQRAERVRGCVSVLGEFSEHAHLFADRVQLCAVKEPEDVRNLVRARVAEHQQREAERLESERARIRQEEAERARRELELQEVQEAKRVEQQRRAQAADDLAATEQDTAKGIDGSAAPEPSTKPQVAPAQLSAGAARPPVGARIKLGDINSRIAPMTITADGLAQLGFRPVGTERVAKLYAAADFPKICDTMISVLQAATQKKAA